MDHGSRFARSQTVSAYRLDEEVNRIATLFLAAARFARPRSALSHRSAWQARINVVDWAELGAGGEDLIATTRHPAAGTEHRATSSKRRAGSTLPARVAPGETRRPRSFALAGKA